MQIFVKHYNGIETITLDVDPHFTIDNIMWMIAGKEGTPYDQQRLAFKEKDLDDESLTLGDCNITSGSTLRLSLTLDGGAKGKLDKDLALKKLKILIRVKDGEKPTSALPIDGIVQEAATASMTLSNMIRSKDRDHVVGAINNMSAGQVEALLSDLGMIELDGDEQKEIFNADRVIKLAIRHFVPAAGRVEDATKLLLEHQEHLVSLFAEIFLRELSKTIVQSGTMQMNITKFKDAIWARRDEIKNKMSTEETVEMLVRQRVQAELARIAAQTGDVQM
jgi:Ubiquitin family